MKKKSPFESIPISKIEPCKVRKADLDGWAASLRKIGLHEGIILCHDGQGKTPYKVVPGHGAKRLEAMRLLGKKEIKAIVLDRTAYSESAIIAWAKYIDRYYAGKLRNYSLAAAAQTMETRHNVLGAEFSAKLGISTSYLYNLTRWYRLMPPYILKEWAKGNPVVSHQMLENYSHMTAAEVKRAWETRKTKRVRRIGERKIRKLSAAINESALNKPAKKIATDIIRFVLGETEEVPGITDYAKLPPEIIDKR